MASAGRTPCELPGDYQQHWRDLAEWSIKHLHGPSARYALMFALCLRRSVLADRAHITYVSPRVWEVRDRVCTSQRLSLFDDALTRVLLDTVDTTTDFPTPLFPNCACGSHRTDDWAHGLASRKLYRGHTNFQALSVEFKIEAGPQWTPLEIYLVSLCIFRNTVATVPRDECELLMNQLGVKLPRNVFHHAHWFKCAQTVPTGTANIVDGQTRFRDNQERSPL